MDKIRENLGLMTPQEYVKWGMKQQGIGVVKKRTGGGTTATTESSINRASLKDSSGDRVSSKAWYNQRRGELLESIQKRREMMQKIFNDAQERTDVVGGGKMLSRYQQKELQMMKSANEDDRNAWRRLN